MNTNTILFSVQKGLKSKIASQMLDDGVINDMMPLQKTYQKKRRKELRRLLYNLVKVVSTSRATRVWHKLAVPMAMIKSNEKMYHTVSWRGLKSVLDTLEKHDIITVKKGTPFSKSPASWKKKMVNNNKLQGRMTLVNPSSELKKLIGNYLYNNTHIGADVDILVKPERVVLEEDNKFIKYWDSDYSRSLLSRLNDVNNNTPQSGILSIPISSISTLTTSNSSYTLLHTIKQNTSPHPPTESIHQAVLERFGEAMDWNYNFEDGCIKYEIPEEAFTYKRKFVRGSWDCGGRFYCPIQNLPSEWRRFLEIDGHPVVELDYDNLHIGILYAKEGEQLEGDAYEIDFDLGEEVESIVDEEIKKEVKERYRNIQRKVVKRVMNTLINSPNHQSLYGSLKQGTDWESEVGVPVPNQVFTKIVDSIKKRHSVIENYFHSDVGIKLQYEDSQLAEKIMLETGAVGIHDGFLTTIDKKDELRKIMKKVFEEKYKKRIEVSKEFE